jgi:hypothetical protein
MLSYYDLVLCRTMIWSMICVSICRLVADGHLTDIPLESVYSGVVSLRGFRIGLFLAELNHLKIWATDIGNAYI